MAFFYCFVNKNGDECVLFRDNSDTFCTNDRFQISASLVPHETDCFSFFFLIIRNQIYFHQGRYRCLKTYNWNLCTLDLQLQVFFHWKRWKLDMKQFLRQIFQLKNVNFICVPIILYLICAYQYIMPLQALLVLLSNWLCLDFTIARMWLIMSETVPNWSLGAQYNPWDSIISAAQFSWKVTSIAKPCLAFQ